MCRCCFAQEEGFEFGGGEGGDDDVGIVDNLSIFFIVSMAVAVKHSPVVL
jgi:hypothetical protein